MVAVPILVVAVPILVVAVASLVVIPEGDLLLSLRLPVFFATPRTTAAPDTNG
jgi:hypothetical protein